MTPEQIAEALSQAIREQEFPPGAPLIQEDLAKRFTVSRNPVREALRMLASNGLVTITQGNGATVRKLSAEELNELYDIRLVLELQIAPHIVDGATGRALQSLRRLLDQMEQASSTAEWLRLNFSFHQMVYGLADRPHTERILNSVLSSVQPYSIQNVEQLGGRSRSDDAHAQIVDAIEERNAERLASLFREHLEDTRSKLEQLFSQEPS